MTDVTAANKLVVQGKWLGHGPTGRRFQRVAEVAIFQIRDGKIIKAWSLEDTLSRLQQLGLLPTEL